MTNIFAFTKMDLLEISAGILAGICFARVADSFADHCV